MPVVEFGGGSAVVISGHTHGVDGVADTYLPINYLHIKVYPEEEVVLKLRSSRTTRPSFTSSAEMGSSARRASRSAEDRWRCSTGKPGY